MRKSLLPVITGLALLTACSGGPKAPSADEGGEEQETTEMQKKLDAYAPFRLTADISHLSADEKEMLKLLFEASGLMDDIFWKQNIGEKEAFLNSIGDEDVRAYARINYGP